MIEGMSRDWKADRETAMAAIKDAEKIGMVDPLLLAWADTLEEVERLNCRLRMQDDALKRAGSAARFAIDPAQAQELKAMIVSGINRSGIWTKDELRGMVGLSVVFADNGDELEKQYQEEADAMERIAELEAELKNVYKALESLTPGGSEFFRDAGRCSEYVKERQDKMHRILTDRARRERELEAQNAVLRQALEEIRGGVICGHCDDYTVRAGDDYEEPPIFCFKTDKATHRENTCENWEPKNHAAEIAHKALQATPAQAAERVHGMVDALVDALEYAANFNHPEVVKFVEENKNQDWDYSKELVRRIRVKAEQALAKWEGRA